VYGNVVCNQKVYSVAGCPMCKLRWFLYSEKEAMQKLKYLFWIFIELVFKTMKTDLVLILYCKQNKSK
jgi:hypothetical protein